MARTPLPDRQQRLDPPPQVIRHHPRRTVPLPRDSFNEPARKGIWLRPGLLLGALTPVTDGLEIGCGRLSWGYR
jgi:hypothetical protein